ncbi:MAG TPA: VOC family protein [Candidatus Margulisiibacteriota bacterium]|nr:VOC family protein [Candidatus Margulisiibacteriota bacterium]
MTAKTVPHVEGRKLSLSHFGLSCFDLDRMEDFYTRVLGMTVTDRGAVPGGGARLVFLTTDPSEHHQLVLASGRTEGSILEGPVLGGSFGAAVFQLTFRLEDLATLRRVQQRLLAEGNTNFVPLNHGNSWSLYTRDPEGNALELVVDSPWYVHQPFGELFDLALDDAEILRQTEELCRATGDWEPVEDWRAKLAQRIAADQARLR